MLDAEYGRADLAMRPAQISYFPGTAVIPFKTAARGQITDRHGDIALVDPRPLLRQGLVSALQSILGSRGTQEFSSIESFLSTAEGKCSILVATEQSLHDCDDTLLQSLTQALAKASLRIVCLKERSDRAGSALLSTLGNAGMIFLPENCLGSAFTRKIGELLMVGCKSQTGDKSHLGEPTSNPSIECLTIMQYRVLELIAEGLLNKQIAYRCSISEATVKSHASEIFRKLKIQRRSEAAVIYTRLISGRNAIKDRGPVPFSTPKCAAL